MPQAETPSPGAPGDDPGRQEPQRLATGRAALVIPVATHIELRRETQQGGGHAGDIEPVDAPVPRDRPRHVAIEAERADRVWIPAKRLAQAVSSTPGVALLETEPGQERQRAEPCPRLGQPHGVGQRRASEVTVEEPGHVLDRAIQAPGHASPVDPIHRNRRPDARETAAPSGQTEPHLPVRGEVETRVEAASGPRRSIMVDGVATIFDSMSWESASPSPSEPRPSVAVPSSTSHAYHAPATAATSGRWVSSATCAAVPPRTSMSSASRKTTYFPAARARPAFRAAETPRPSSCTTRTFPSNPRRTVAVPSVEPSSTTMTSTPR